MKRRIITVINYMLLLCIMLSSAPLFSAQESASSVAQKEEQSRLQRIDNWLYAQYGMPKRDWKIIKKWLIKKWRRQEIEPELDKKAKSIFKKYIIPVVVIAALIGLSGGWWWRVEKRIERAKRKVRLIDERRIQESEKRAAQERAMESLMQAVKGGQEEEVKLLLDKGADIEARNKWRHTPLIKAARRGHEKIVELLLDRGADIEAKDKWGNTPLFQAAWRGHEEVVELLLDRGADVNVTTKYYWTPLTRAAGEGHEKVVELLLEGGADVNIKALGKKTAAELAETKEIKELIEEYPRRKKEAEAFLFERGTEPSYEVPPGVQEHITSYILGGEYTSEHKEKYERRKQKAEERKKAAQEELPTGREARGSRGIIFNK